MLEPASYFHDIIEHFDKKGYVRGETIRAAPFDWRFAAGEWNILNLGSMFTVDIISVMLTLTSDVIVLLFG